MWLPLYARQHKQPSKPCSRHIGLNGRQRGTQPLPLEICRWRRHRAKRASGSEGWHVLTAVTHTTHFSPRDTTFHQPTFAFGWLTVQQRWVVTRLTFTFITNFDLLLKVFHTQLSIVLDFSDLVSYQNLSVHPFFAYALIDFENTVLFFLCLSIVNWSKLNDSGLVW